MIYDVVLVAGFLLAVEEVAEQSIWANCVPSYQKAEVNGANKTLFYFLHCPGKLAAMLYLCGIVHENQHSFQPQVLALESSIYSLVRVLVPNSLTKVLDMPTVISMVDDAKDVMRFSGQVVRAGWL